MLKPNNESQSNIFRLLIPEISINDFEEILCFIQKSAYFKAVFESAINEMQGLFSGKHDHVASMYNAIQSFVDKQIIGKEDHGEKSLLQLMFVIYFLQRPIMEKMSGEVVQNLLTKCKKFFIFIIVNKIFEQSHKSFCQIAQLLNEFLKAHSNIFAAAEKNILQQAIAERFSIIHYGSYCIQENFVFDVNQLLDACVKISGDKVVNKLLDELGKRFVCIFDNNRRVLDFMRLDMLKVRNAKQYTVNVNGRVRAIKAKCLFTVNNATMEEVLYQTINTITQDNNHNRGDATKAFQQVFYQTLQSYCQKCLLVYKRVERTNINQLVELILKLGIRNRRLFNLLHGVLYEIKSENHYDTPTRRLSQQDDYNKDQVKVDIYKKSGFRLIFTLANFYVQHADKHEDNQNIVKMLRDWIKHHGSIKKQQSTLIGLIGQIRKAKEKAINSEIYTLWRKIELKVLYFIHESKSLKPTIAISVCENDLSLREVCTCWKNSNNNAAHFIRTNLFRDSITAINLFRLVKAYLRHPELESIADLVICKLYQLESSKSNNTKSAILLLIKLLGRFLPNKGGMKEYDEYFAPALYKAIFNFKGNFSSANDFMGVLLKKLKTEIFELKIQKQKLKHIFYNRNFRYSIFAIELLFLEPAQINAINENFFVRGLKLNVSGGYKLSDQEKQFAQQVFFFVFLLLKDENLREKISKIAKKQLKLTFPIMQNSISFLTEVYVRFPSFYANIDGELPKILNRINLPRDFCENVGNLLRHCINKQEIDSVNLVGYKFFKELFKQIDTISEIFSKDNISDCHLFALLRLKMQLQDLMLLIKQAKQKIFKSTLSNLDGLFSKYGKLWRNILRYLYGVDVDPQKKLLTIIDLDHDGFIRQRLQCIKNQQNINKNFGLLLDEYEKKIRSFYNKLNRLSHSCKLDSRKNTSLYLIDQLNLRLFKKAGKKISFIKDFIINLYKKELERECFDLYQEFKKTKNPLKLLCAAMLLVLAYEPDIKFEGLLERITRTDHDWLKIKLFFQRNIQSLIIKESAIIKGFQVFGKYHEHMKKFKYDRSSKFAYKLYFLFALRKFSNIYNLASLFKIVKNKAFQFIGSSSSSSKLKRSGTKKNQEFILKMAKFFKLDLDMEFFEYTAGREKLLVKLAQKVLYEKQICSNQLSSFFPPTDTGGLVKSHEGKKFPFSPSSWSRKLNERKNMHDIEILLPGNSDRRHKLLLEYLYNCKRKNDPVCEQIAHDFTTIYLDDKSFDPKRSLNIEALSSDLVEKLNHVSTRDDIIQCRSPQFKYSKYFVTCAKKDNCITYVEKMLKNTEIIGVGEIIACAMITKQFNVCVWGEVVVNNKEIQQLRAYDKIIGKPMYDILYGNGRVLGYYKRDQQSRRPPQTIGQFLLRRSVKNLRKRLSQFNLSKITPFSGGFGFSQKK